MSALLIAILFCVATVSGEFEGREVSVFSNPFMAILHVSAYPLGATYPLLLVMLTLKTLGFKRSRTRRQPKIDW